MTIKISSNYIKLFFMFWNTIASWTVAHSICLLRSVVAVYCAVFCHIEASTDSRGVCACSPEPNHMCGIWTDPTISTLMDSWVQTAKVQTLPGVPPAHGDFDIAFPCCAHETSCIRLGAMACQLQMALVRTKTPKYFDHI